MAILISKLAFLPMVNEGIRTAAQHLFGIENIVVVHHTYCGATSFTPEGLITASRAEQGVDISALYDRDNVAIAGYESSLKRDTRLIRESKGTPRNVNIYGCLFNIDTETLTLVVEDKNSPQAGA